MPILAKRTVFKSIPADTYWGELQAIAVKQIKQPDGTMSDSYEWEFIVQDGPQKGEKITGLTSQNWSERTKVYAWAKALNGGKPFASGDSEEVDLEGLLGKECFIEVVERANGKGTKVENLAPVIRMDPPPRAEAKEAKKIEL
jgi:hypothetical protein